MSRAAHEHARVRLSVFAQRLVAAHDMAVEFECAIRQKASRPPLRILSVDRLAIARAQLLDGELFDPSLSIVPPSVALPGLSGDVADEIERADILVGPQLLR